MTIANDSLRDVTPEDIAAIDKILQHIDHQNAKRTVLATLANWVLALKIYKEIELRFTCMQDRSHLVQSHRALLCSIMATGECLITASEDLTDTDFARIQITKAALHANVAYLRNKYAQWYAKRDPAQIAAADEAVRSH